MITDSIIAIFAWFGNTFIGGILRLSSPVEINTGILSAILEFQKNIYLINIFTPISEIGICLGIIGTALITWGTFKLTMWIFDLFRIGKSYK